MHIQPIGEQLKIRIEELKTLRDEIRLDLHLASMALRDEWKHLEYKLPDSGRLADLKETTEDAFEYLAAELRKFRERLHEKAAGRTVAGVMKAAISCGPNDSLAVVVTSMWDHDIGFLPVTGDAGRLLGVVTDRDACIAACTRGKRMDEIPVETVMSKVVAICGPGDALNDALAVMRDRRVRRLPVVTDGRGVVGVVSLQDLARVFGRGEASEVLDAYLLIAAPPAPAACPLQ